MIEGGIDAMEGKMGEIRWREIGRERKGERGQAASLAVIYDV